MNSDKINKRFMLRAMELAEKSAKNKEVPIGAVITLNDEIIGESGNMVESDQNPTHHAEIIAINQATQNVKYKHLLNTNLYVTLEPCAMCAGAIVLARIPRVIIASKDPKTGAAGSVINILQNNNLNHRCELEFGLLEEESSKLLKSFFKELRKPK